LRGGNGGFWPLLTCGGPLKYEQLGNIHHEDHVRNDPRASSDNHSSRVCFRFSDKRAPEVGNSRPRTANRPYSRGCLGTFFIRILEKRDEEKRELAEKPTIAIGEISEHVGIFKVRSESETKELYAHIIAVTVTNGSVAAFDIMAGGSVVPPFTPGALMPYGWLRGTRIYEPIIDISPPFPGERPVVEEIGTRIFQRISREREVLIPNISAVLLLGLTFSGYPFAFIGDLPVQLPYEGSIVVRVYNEKYGSLAEKTFKVKIESYSKISFE